MRWACEDTGRFAAISLTTGLLSAHFRQFTERETEEQRACHAIPRVPAIQILPPKELVNEYVENRCEQDGLKGQTTWSGFNSI